LTPENQGQKISETEKQKNRKRNKRRSAIEPVIGHLKSDFRMFRNFLKGTLGDEINAIMAAAAFNFMKWRREAKLYLHLLILRLLTAFYANRTLNA
jgi:IS5 family transposase